MAEALFRVDINKTEERSTLRADKIYYVEVEKDGRLIQRQGYLTPQERDNAFRYMIGRYTELECRLFVEGIPADNLVTG